MPTKRAPGSEGDPAAAVRAAIQQAMASAEPPIRPGIVGGALVEARRIRRWRRLAGASALAAIVPAVAIGTAAAHRGAGQAVPHGTFGYTRSLAQGAGIRPQLAVNAAPVLQALPLATPASLARLRKTAVGDAVVYSFVRPVLPAARPSANPVPITARSFAQLLLDQLPGGAVHTPVMATVDAAASQDQLSLANFDQVTTARGEGSVSVQLIRARTPGAAFGCGALSAGESCRTYTLGSGVAVNETAVTASWESDGTLLAVTVFRPDTGLISIEENTTSITGAAANTLPPLTLRQLVSAALDPRWGYTIGKAFAAGSSNLAVEAASEG